MTKTNPDRVKQRLAEAGERAARRSKSVAEAAEARSQEATGTVRRFVADHPLIAVGAGLAVGAIVASMIPGVAPRAGRLARRAAKLAAIGAEVAAVTGSRAAENAASATRSGAERLVDLGEDFLDNLSDNTESVRKRAGEMADRLGSSTVSAGQSTVRKLIDLAGRAIH